MRDALGAIFVSFLAMLAFVAILFGAYMSITPELSKDAESAIAVAEKLDAGFCAHNHKQAVKDLDFVSQHTHLHKDVKVAYEVAKARCLPHARQTYCDELDQSKYFQVTCADNTIFINTPFEKAFGKQLYHEIEDSLIGYMLFEEVYIDGVQYY